MATADTVAVKKSDRLKNLLQVFRRPDCLSDRISGLWVSDLSPNG